MPTNPTPDDIAALRAECERLSALPDALSEAEHEVQSLQAENQRLRNAHNGEVCVDVQEYCERLEAENQRLRAELRAAHEIVQARDAAIDDMKAERIARTETRGGIIDDLTRRAVAAERKVEAARELRDAAAEMVRATDEWNSAVESIIGRRAETQIDLERTRDAVKAFDAAGDGT